MHKIKITDHREQLIECLEYEQEKDFHRILKQCKSNPIYLLCLIEESNGQKVANLKVENGYSILK